MNQHFDDGQYFIVKKKAIPEVLLKVVEAKRLLDAEKVDTAVEAADLVGISRSSFYKYKDDIFPFYENTRGKTVTFMIQVDDRPGLLSIVLNCLAKNETNILTIHQSIPVNGIASLTISVELPSHHANPIGIFNEIERIEGIHYLKILARE